MQRLNCRNIPRFNEEPCGIRRLEGVNDEASSAVSKIFSRTIMRLFNFFIWSLDGTVFLDFALQEFISCGRNRERESEKEDEGWEEVIQS